METIKAGAFWRGFVRARLQAAGIKYIEGKSFLYSEFHIAQEDLPRARTLFLNPHQTLNKE